MTCLEKYKLEHIGEEPNMQLWCPNGTGEIDILDPDYCPKVNGRPECVECWNREVPDEQPEPTITHDVINHPKHYCREGGMESIDEMLLVFGKEAAMNFCLLNVWKYRYRAAGKNGAEDLRKSDWYMAKYKELKGDD